MNSYGMIFFQTFDICLLVIAINYTKSSFMNSVNFVIKFSTVIHPY